MLGVKYLAFFKVFETETSPTARCIQDISLLHFIIIKLFIDSFKLTLLTISIKRFCVGAYGYEPQGFFRPHILTVFFIAEAVSIISVYVLVGISPCFRFFLERVGGGGSARSRFNL